MNANSSMSLEFSLDNTFLKTASATPPELPNITPPPVLKPRGISNADCSRFAKERPDSSIILASSCVVKTISVSGIPSCESSGLVASNFLAVQGITETTIKSSLFMLYILGNISFAKEPNIP